MLTLLYEIKLNGNVFNPCYEIRRLEDYNNPIIGHRNFSKISIKNPNGNNSRLTEESLKEMVEDMANGVAESKNLNWKVKDFIIVKYSKDTCLVVVTYPEVK